MAEQGPAEDSLSNDGALTMTSGVDLFPGARTVHVWQFTRPIIGRRIVIDVVDQDGKLLTGKFKPQEFFKK